MKMKLIKLKLSKMSNKMGYIVIAIGIAIVVMGIMLLTKQKTIEKPITTSEKPRQEKEKSVDLDENKAKGDAFERFVVKQFDKKYFTLQEWRSDKYVDGIYDYDIVIRISDIDKIRDEWNSISKGEFKKLLYCKYDNQHSNVSDGFYLVKDYINKLTNKIETI